MLNIFQHLAFACLQSILLYRNLSSKKTPYYWNFRLFLNVVVTNNAVTSNFVYASLHVSQKTGYILTSGISASEVMHILKAFGIIAENTFWKVCVDFLSLLQSMGYLLVHNSANAG